MKLPLFGPILTQGPDFKHVEKHSEVMAVIIEFPLKIQNNT
jgi:hypothetical protein